MTPPRPVYINIIDARVSCGGDDGRRLHGFSRVENAIPIGSSCRRTGGRGCDTPKTSAINSIRLNRLVHAIMRDSAFG